MADGLPPPALGELVFEATLELGDTHEFGATQYGARTLLDIVGGEFNGERASGSFLTGGLDLTLVLSNDTSELEQINILRTSDGALIYMRSCGLAAAGDSGGRVVVDFEAPNSSAVAWLNEGSYVAERSVDTAAGSMTLVVYDVSDVTPPEASLVFSDPAGDLDQPWECSTETGGQGETVFTENVTLGSSLSVGESKRGTRNIIPITGGTVSGRFNGIVVPGGADYQLIGGTTTLDARYTLKSDDDEYVLVRNCGPFGALVPLFEARQEGPYAFLNENTFVSSDPGGGAGGVSITFYERQ